MSAFDDEPAVLLVNEDAEALPIIPPQNVGPDEKTHISVKEELKEEGEMNVASFVTKTFSHLKSKQDQIDDGRIHLFKNRIGIFKKKGPGRKRKHDPRTSKQLEDLVRCYLKTSLSKIVSNNRCKKRKDALITIAMRCLK